MLAADQGKGRGGMAILKIARMGHPVLCRPAEAVADPTAPEVERLVADMIETMMDVPGIGLAAPQVHVGKRIVVFRVPGRRAAEAADEAGEEEPANNDDGDDGPQPLTVLINPEIEPLGDETAIGWEGCLSLPGLSGAVPRLTRIRYRGVTDAGEAVERTASGFHARVVQHECDHLDGILYPQRMTDLSQFGFTEDLRRGMPEDGGPEDL